MFTIVFFKIIQVTYDESDNNTVYYRPDNQEWYVSRITTERNERSYACCKETYPDVTFTIHMTRRSLFYVVNLIFPCLLIYAVAFLGFFLPVESGEKVNLEITILLALVVFLLIVGETLPPTPDAIPVLGILFGTTMLMVSIALVMAVIVTNIYLRKDAQRPVPNCLRYLFGMEKCRRKIESPKIRAVGDARPLRDIRDATIELDSLSIERNHIFERRRSSDSRESISHDKDWLILAKIVDRICFWIFLSASVTAISAMYMSIPSFNTT